MTEIMKKFAEARIKTKKLFQNVRFSPALIELNEIVQTLPRRNSEYIEKLIAKGWFPIQSILTPAMRREYGDDIDLCMTENIDNCFDIYTENLIKNFPERAEILKEAFEMHITGNYNSSILLLLTQADGICNDVGYNHYFSEGREKLKKEDSKLNNKFSERVTYLIDKGVLIIDEYLISMFTPILRSEYKDLPISKKIADIEEGDAFKFGANRHAVIHGSLKQLDYGSKLNSYKALSFIFYLDLLIHDVLKLKD